MFQCDGITRSAPWRIFFTPDVTTHKAITATAGLNVFLGQFKLQAAYQTSHANGAPAANNGSTSTQRVWGGATWQATAAAALTGAVYHVNANHGGGNANIYTIGGTYNISKRTLLDMQIATVRNSKNANFGLESNAAGAGGGYNDNPTPGHSQTGVYADIQHQFRFELAQVLEAFFHVA